MASEHWITVGVLQLRGHPAVVVGDHDYLEEPTWPVIAGQLAGLSRSIPELERARKNIRQGYIKWAEAQLPGVLDAIREARELPDILVLPECSVPGELRPALRGRLESQSTVVCAGTHTPMLTGDMSTAYQRAGVNKADRERVPAAVAVLPILLPSGTKLHPKQAPSVFERVPQKHESKSPLEVRRQQVTSGDRRLELALFVCSEAHRLPN